MAQHERHPNITMARDIAFQGRHDEGVLERTNLILYKRFRENVDEWRKLRAEDFENAGIKKEVLCVVGGNISLVLLWNAFASPDYDFINFPHEKVVELFLSHKGNDKLVMFVKEGLAVVTNQSGNCGFEFIFEEDKLVTLGVGTTIFSLCDPMEGKSLMTKLSAAAEFVDMFDMKLSDFGALTPAKAS